MNATIQEIEGIDDYWGPAFRSVYEGEGHEAFVQQLDDRIVQHDKEIEKLCNFHYQPKKRKRQRHPRKPVKPAGVFDGSVEDHHSQDSSTHHHSSNHEGSHHQHGHNTTAKHYNLSDTVLSSYGGNDRCGPKKRRIDPSRLGGYSNVFPKSGNTMEVGDVISTNPDNSFDVSPEVDKDSNDEYDGYTDGTPDLGDYIEAKQNREVASEGMPYCEEYEEIVEYHDAAEQLKQRLEDESDMNSTSDLRLYLRNRNRRHDASVEHDHDEGISTSERKCGQIHNISEGQIDRDIGASADRLRGRSCGMPAELRPTRNSSDYGPSTNRDYNRDATTDHQRRSRRKAGQKRHDSAERLRYKSRHMAPQLQGSRGIGASDKCHREDSRGEPPSLSHIVFVEGQQNYDASTHCPPVKNKPDDNSSSDLRSFLKSKLAEVDDTDTVNGDRRRRLNRDASNGHNNVLVSRGASSSDNSVHDPDLIEHHIDHHMSPPRQYSQSSLEASKRHRVEHHALSAEHHINQTRNDPTERYTGDTSHAVAEHHIGQRCSLFSKHHKSRSRYDSNERNHGMSRHASADQNIGQSPTLFAEHHNNQSRPNSIECYHASAEHHLDLSRPSSAEHNICESRHDSTERYHVESLPLSAERQLGWNSILPVEVVHNQSRPSSADHNITQSCHDSTACYCSQCRHKSTELCHSESHHGSAKHHVSRSRPSSAKHNISQNRHDSTECYRSQSRHKSTELYHSERRHGSGKHNFSRSRPSLAEHNIIESRHDSTERYRSQSRHNSTELCHGESRHGPAKHHVSRSRPSSTEHNISQSRHDSTECYRSLSRHNSTELSHGESRQGSANHLVSRSRPSSAERNISQSHHDSNERCRSQSRHNSTVLCHGESRHGSAKHHVSRSRPSSTEHNISQSRHDSTECYRSQSRPKSTELSHCESRHESAKHHVSGNRSSSTEHNISQSRHDSTECYRSQSRPKSTELSHCESRHESAKHHVSGSRSSSTEHNISQSPLSVKSYLVESSHLTVEPHNDHLTLAQRYHGQCLRESTEHHHSESRVKSNERQSLPLYVEIHHNRNRYVSAELHHGRRSSLSAEVDLKQGHHASAEHYHVESGHASSELHCDSSRSDAKNESIVTLTKSETSHDAISKVTADVDFGPSIDDLYAERHCLLAKPDKKNGFNDSRSNLHSYLKSKFTCHREACAPLPNNRGSSFEPIGHSREASTESRHSRAECRIDFDRATSAETVIVHLDQGFGTAHRQCITPEPDKSNDEVADDRKESASVSCNLSTRHWDEPNQSYKEPAKLLCPSSLPETNVKSEPNDNSTSTRTSQRLSPDELEKVRRLLPQGGPLTVYSKRQFRQKHDASIEIPLRPDTKEHRKIADQPTLKKCQYNILVRDVESINQSTLLLPSEAKSSLLNVAATSCEADACERGHSDASSEVSAVSVGSWFIPSEIEVFSKSNEKSNLLNAAVNNSDPKLQPRNSYSASAENPNSPLKPDAQSDANSNAKPEPNIKSLNAVFASRDPRLQSRYGCEAGVQNSDKIVKSLPYFDPSDKSQSLSSWVSRVNEMAISCNWTDQQVVAYAMSKLVGNAKRWYEGFTSNFSWKEWQTKLETAFPYTENYGKLLLDMLNKTAKVGDSLEDYYLEKISMLNKCSIRGKRAVECIVFGIEDETIRTKAEAENFEHPDKLLSFLGNFEKNINDSCAVNMAIIYND